jgi:RND family efflux transporter MFP subunit
MPNLTNFMMVKHPLIALGLCLGLVIGVSAGQAGASELNFVDGITEPFLDVTMSASVAGIITSQKFREGDFVKEGDVILELDKKLEELETARRKLVVDNKKVDFDATEVLYKTTKAVSGEEREKKQVEYKIAAVEHDMAAEQLRRRSVASPLAGVITEVMLHVGEACQPYQPLIRVVDVRRVYFVANMEARAAAMLKQGQSVKLEIETGAAALPVEGKISFLSPVADPASGLLKVKVLFENPEGKVRPGLAGKLSLK